MTTRWQRVAGSLLTTTLVLGACGDDGGSSNGSGETGGTSGTTMASASGATLTTTSSTSEGTSTSTTTDTGDTSTDTGQDSGSTTAVDTGSTGSIPTVTVSGSVSDFLNGNDVEGMSVCVFGHDEIPCAMTDMMGAYTLAGVPSEDGAISFESAGYYPGLFWGAAPQMDSTLNYSALPNVAANLMASQLGETIDDNLGHLAVSVVDQNGDSLAGVSFEVTPASGAGGYLTAQGSMDPDLTETTDAGFAGWVNMDVAEVQIVASHATLTCTAAAQAIEGDTPDSIRISAEAGYLGSTFPFVCQ